MLVFDGRRQLILYGTAEGLSADPERLEATKRLRRAWAATSRTTPPSRGSWTTRSE